MVLEDIVNLVSNSSFCLDLELEFELGVDNRIVAYATGLSQNDFINPPVINQSFKNLFEEGKYSRITSQLTMNNHYILLLKQRIFSKQLKKAAHFFENSFPTVQKST